MRVRSCIILPMLHWLQAHVHHHTCPQHVVIRIGADGHRIACFGFQIDGTDWIVGNIDLDGPHPDHAPQVDRYDCS